MGVVLGSRQMSRAGEDVRDLMVATYRGKRISGGGKEWFKTTRDEIIAICESVAQSRQAT
jgi:hypothetical protein